MIAIRIHTANSAFAEGESLEVARIFEEVVKRLQQGVPLDNLNGVPLFDINGNCVGQIEAHSEAEEES